MQPSCNLPDQQGGEEERQRQPPRMHAREERLRPDGGEQCEHEGQQDQPVSFVHDDYVGMLGVTAASTVSCRPGFAACMSESHCRARGGRCKAPAMSRNRSSPDYLLDL